MERDSYKLIDSFNNMNGSVIGWTWDTRFHSRDHVVILVDYGDLFFEKYPDKRCSQFLLMTPKQLKLELNKIQMAWKSKG